MFRRCAGRVPDETELSSLASALEGFRRRYGEAPEDARRLVEVGGSPVPEGADVASLAAWTLVASALFNLDATICRG